MIDVMIKLLPGGRMPQYMSAGAAGMDCYAREGGIIHRPASRIECAPMGSVTVYRTKVPLGFALSLPEGYEAQLRPRSGLGWKDGVHCALGTIDSDYTGEVSAILFNVGNVDFKWESGARICQLIIAPVARAVLHQVDELEATCRGQGGFGSTGK